MRPGAGARGAALGCLTAAAAAAACVRIDTAPGGVASVRLGAAPPSIALGDSLRDTAGAAVPVSGVAYDANGLVTATAGFRYSYLPVTPDTTRGAVVDTALVVDSVTGAVRATGRWVQSRGRVLARLGGGAQLADTIQIVPRPDTLVPTRATDTLRYDCRDRRTALVERDTISGVVNTVGPFTLAVLGDSAGARVGVGRWLVRWTLDSLPAAVPTVAADSTGRQVPAIGVVTGTADQFVRYDTTALTTGASSVRLRIRPFGLDEAYSRDTVFTVTLRADVIRGRGSPVPGGPVRGVYRVLLSRRATAANGAAVTCRQ